MLSKKNRLHTLGPHPTPGDHNLNIHQVESTLPDDDPHQFQSFYPNGCGKGFFPLCNPPPHCGPFTSEDCDLNKLESTLGGSFYTSFRFSGKIILKWRFWNIFVIYSYYQNRHCGPFYPFGIMIWANLNRQ